MIIFDEDDFFRFNPEPLAKVRGIVSSALKKV